MGLAQPLFRSRIQAGISGEQRGSLQASFVHDQCITRRERGAAFNGPAVLYRELRNTGVLNALACYTATIMRTLLFFQSLGFVFAMQVALSLATINTFAAEVDLLIIVGPSNHPPGSHEVAAGGRLLKNCLENAANVPGIKASVFYEWPKDETVLDAASTVVFIGDTFPPARFPDSDVIMEKLGTMMDRGCGIVCLHYATGLRAEDVADDGEHPLLGWMGGYFATGTKHHRSVARIFERATIAFAAPEHPVSRGCREFTLNDEPYINNYFGPDGNRMASNVTALAVSMLPPESPKREVVAWCAERKDGGRGFGIVMPHFFRNWQIDDLRRFILNGIVWTSKLEVPKIGVQTASPALATFKPASVEPKSR